MDLPQNKIDALPPPSGVTEIPEGSSGWAFNHCIPDPPHGSLKPRPHSRQQPWPRLFLLTSSSPDLEVPWTGVGSSWEPAQRGLFGPGTVGGWGWSPGAQAGDGAPLRVPRAPPGPAEFGERGQKGLRGVGSPNLRVSKDEVGLCTPLHRWGG